MQICTGIHAHSIYIVHTLHAHTHTRTHAHTLKKTQTETETQTQTQTQTQTFTYTHLHTYMPDLRHVTHNTLVCTHTYTRKDV